MREKTNWNTPHRFSLFSVKEPLKAVAPQKAPIEAPPIQKAPTPKPIKAAPPEKKPAAISGDQMDAMLQSIDADLALCNKVPKRLQVACKLPDHPFYTKLKAAIAAHIGDLTTGDKADLILTTEKSTGPNVIELLAPEAYDTEKKRELWARLKKRAGLS